MSPGWAAAARGRLPDVRGRDQWRTVVAAARGTWGATAPGAEASVPWGQRYRWTRERRTRETPAVSAQQPLLSLFTSGWSEPSARPLRMRRPVVDGAARTGSLVRLCVATPIG